MPCNNLTSFFYNYYFLFPVQVNQADMELSVAPDKVQIVKWHPLAKDILCTVAFDKSVKIWDLNKTENGPQLELQVQIKDKTRVKKLTVFKAAQNN